MSIALNVPGNTHTHTSPPKQTCRREASEARVQVWVSDEAINRVSEAPCPLITTPVNQLTL